MANQLKIASSLGRGGNPVDPATERRPESRLRHDGAEQSL